MEKLMVWWTSSLPDTSFLVKCSQQLPLPFAMLVGSYFCSMGSRSRVENTERQGCHMVLTCEAGEESRGFLNLWTLYSSISIESISSLGPFGGHRGVLLPRSRSDISIINLWHYQSQLPNKLQRYWGCNRRERGQQISSGETLREEF